MAEAPSFCRRRDGHAVPPTTEVERDLPPQASSSGHERRPTIYVAPRMTADEVLLGFPTAGYPVSTCNVEYVRHSRPAEPTVTITAIEAELAGVMEDRPAAPRERRATAGAAKSWFRESVFGERVSVPTSSADAAGAGSKHRRSSVAEHAARWKRKLSSWILRKDSTRGESVSEHGEGTALMKKRQGGFWGDQVPEGLDPGGVAACAGAENWPYPSTRERYVERTRQRSDGEDGSPHWSPPRPKASWAKLLDGNPDGNLESISSLHLPERAGVPTGELTDEQAAEIIQELHPLRRTSKSVSGGPLAKEPQNRGQGTGKQAHGPVVDGVTPLDSHIDQEDVDILASGIMKASEDGQFDEVPIAERFKRLAAEREQAADSFQVTPSALTRSEATPVAGPSNYNRSRQSDASASSSGLNLEESADWVDEMVATGVEVGKVFQQANLINL